MDIGTLTGSIEIEDEVSSRLNFISNTVAAFAENFDGAMGIAAASVGLVATAIAGLTSTIIALGNRGSDINDVAATLDHFAGSAENALAITDRMREGVKGTITDFNLAGTASRLLSANVKLSADQFGTLTQAAFVLQNRGLGTTQQMLDLVSNALITGRTRMLAMKLGVVEVADAEADFARKLGITKDQLSASGVAEARRIAIMKMMETAVADAGEQERDFGENMVFAVTQIKNWGDELASAVAKSESVNRAVRNIGQALVEAFGGTADEVLRRIVGWVNSFADAVGHYAPIIIRWVGDIIDKVRNFYSRVLEYWDTVPDWFKNIAKEAVVTAGVLYISSQAIDAVAGATKDATDIGAAYATMASGTRDVILSAVAAQQMWGARLLDFGKNLTLQIAMVRTFGVQVALVSAAQAIWAGGLSTIVAGITGVGGAILAFIVSPIGLVISGAALLVGGLRVLTGSWEFLLVPIRMAWQALQDVWTIGGELVRLIGNELGPVLSDVGAIFVHVGGLISSVFTESLKQARIEAMLLWEFIKQTGPVQEALDVLALLHIVAEKIRRDQAVTPIMPGVQPLLVMPGAALPKPSVPGAGGVDVPNFRKASTDAEEYRKKVDDLTKSLRNSGEELRIFEAAFARLTPKQLENVEVQANLISRIETLANAHSGTLSPAMQMVYEQALKTRQGFLDNEVAQLKAQNVTLAYVEAQKQLGVSEQTIATLRGVSIVGLQRYIATLMIAAEHEKQQAEVRRSQLTQMAAAQNAGQAAVVRAEKELTQLVREQSRTRLDVQLLDIDDLAQARIDAFVGNEVQEEQFTDFIIEQSRLRKNALLIDNQAILDNSQLHLQQVADRARRTYEFMAAHPERYSRFTIAKFKEIADEAGKQADITRTAWDEAFDSLVDTLEDIPGIIQSAFEGGGGIAGAIKSIGIRLATDILTPLLRGLTQLQKAGVSVGSGLAAALGGQVGGGTGAQIAAITAGLGGAAVAASAWGTAMSTAGIAGTLALGAVTLGIGAAAIAVVALIKHFTNTEGRDAIREFAETFDTIAPGTGFDELHEKLQLLGSDGERLWIALTQGVGRGDKEAAAAAIEDIQRAFVSLDNDIQKYALSWKDIGNKQSLATIAGNELLASYKRLTDAGFTIQAVTKGMSGDISQYVIDVIDAGAKIPEGLRPVILELIKTGQLTEAAARAMLGLKETAMPALADITAAANKYGISLDELGPKVKQLQINELAAEYVADWKILTAATDDWGVIIDKMGPKVQSLVLDAIKYGSTLPTTLKPMIEAFVDAGELVDENGEKLTDLSRFNFAKPLAEMTEDLIAKLDELIEVIRGPQGVAGALRDLGKTKISPIEVPFVYKQTGPIPKGPSVVMSPEEAEEWIANKPTPEMGPMTSSVATMAMGGVVPAPGFAEGATPAKIIQFQPKGTDIVPAMLTPGERVLNIQQNIEYENIQGSLAEIRRGSAVVVNLVDYIANRFGDIQKITQDIVAVEGGRTKGPKTVMSEEEALDWIMNRPPPEMHELLGSMREVPEYTARAEKQQQQEAKLPPVNVTQHISVSLAGAKISGEEDARAIAFALADALQSDGDVRTVLGDEMVSVVIQKTQARKTEAA